MYLLYAEFIGFVKYYTQVYMINKVWIQDAFIRVW